jgi:hypothetical protein
MSLPRNELQRLQEPAVAPTVFLLDLLECYLRVYITEVVDSSLFSAYVLLASLCQLIFVQYKISVLHLVIIHSSLIMDSIGLC